MIEGVDALGNPNPAALVKAGKHFVCQYFKNLTRSQVDAYLAAGLDVVLIYETTGNRYTGGYNYGVADAHSALSLLAAIGAPAGTVVYFAEDDHDVQPSQVPTALAYANGLASVLGASRVGWYGGIRTVSAVLTSGHAKYGWQTYGWSGGKWDSRAQLQQYLNGQSLAGTTVDYDRATVPDFGAWGSTSGGLVMDAEVKAAFASLEAHLQADAANLKTTIDQSTVAIVAAIKASPGGGGGADPAAVATAMLAQVKAKL